MQSGPWWLSESRIVSSKESKLETGDHQAPRCVCHCVRLPQSSESHDFSFIFSSQIFCIFLSSNRWPAVTWNQAGKGILGNIVLHFNGSSNVQLTNHSSTQPLVLCFPLYPSLCSHSFFFSLRGTHFNVLDISSFIVYVAS